MKEYIWSEYVGVRMKDELIVKLERIIKSYAEKYNKYGRKNDRLRRRILTSLLDEIESRLEENKI